MISDTFMHAIQVFIAPVFLSIFIMGLMIQIAFWRNATASWLLSCLALVVAITLSASHLGNLDATQVTPLLVADQFGSLFAVLILFATLVTCLLARDYLANRSGENEEFYLLILLSALGGVILVSATHLASFLLGLELLGVALYALIAYPERGHYPLEAATKYLILSGAASAILLFGFALLYAALGTLEFSEIGTRLQLASAQNNRLIILVGTGLIIAGLSFKLSLIPFHMWTPDVYQGAPSPVTGFLATVSKAAVFAALLRLYISAELYQYTGLLAVLTLIGVASMLGGNLLALQQNNLKRLLAYSSIAHIGYLLITLVVFSVIQAQQLAVEAATFYLVAYVITSLGAFTLLTVLASGQSESDTGGVESIQGLFWTQPMLAVLFMLAMLSLAGIPLTAGFIGKFYLFTLGIEGALWWLIGALVIGSGIGIYYYLRLIFAMSQQPHEKSTASIIVIKWPAKFCALLLVLLILYFGILPQSLMDWLGKLSL